jgi:hypothetical protein
MMSTIMAMCIIVTVWNVLIIHWKVDKLCDALAPEPEWSDAIWYCENCKTSGAVGFGSSPTQCPICSNDGLEVLNSATPNHGLKQ